MEKKTKIKERIKLVLLTSGLAGIVSCVMLFYVIFLFAYFNGTMAYTVWINVLGEANIELILLVGLVPGIICSMGTVMDKIYKIRKGLKQ